MDSLRAFIFCAAFLLQASASPAYILHARNSPPDDGSFNSSTIDIQILQDPLPYFFPPQSAVDTPELFPMETCNGVVIEEATIDDLQNALSSGAFTALELAECYLKRREQVDGFVKYVFKYSINRIPNHSLTNSR
jgi:hypothetical protein